MLSPSHGAHAIEVGRRIQRQDKTTKVRTNMNFSIFARIALLALPLALMITLAPAASAQSLSIGLNCPIFGGTCEAVPQLSGFVYAFRSQGNAILPIPTPATSPAAVVSCLQLLPTTGSVTVTAIAPDGRRGTASVAVCPGATGPVFPF